MSLINSNIRFLRKQKGLTQEELANELEVTRSVIGAYEEGRAEPKLITSQRIANFFGVTLDQLITVDLSEIAIASIRGEEIPSQRHAPASAPAHAPDIEGKKLRVLAITVDKNERENIQLVPQKAAAGYLNGYADPEFIDDLPKFNLPNLPQGTYRAFEISGDSMLPLNPGTIIIGEYVENWSAIKNGKTYIIVTETEGVVYKRVYLQDKTNTLRLLSDNPAYSPYEVKLGDVLEIWASRAYISLDFPDTEMNMQKLTEIVLDLQREVIRLKGE